MRVHLHRPLPEGGIVRSCIFRRDTKGWFVGFALAIPMSPARNAERKVGIDLGISKFVVMSDGGVIPSLRAARRAAAELRRAQRALARRRRGSRGHEKARAQLARCHAAIARRRSDFLHQASARLVSRYDVIALEALNVRPLARSVLARDVCDASWATFISFLRYKAARAGARLIEVSARNTTQDCSDCGARVPKKLNDREHDCPHCGLSLDRDLNAARNVLNRAGVGPGLRNVAEYGKRAGGNLGPAAVRSLKPAA
jgi:putative transposase